MEDCSKPAPTSSTCRRCGACCRKGGPGLHLEDQPLVTMGKIPLKHLLTFRQGEPVYDNISGHIAPAVTDIIKVKGLNRGAASDCPFYGGSQKGCRIYDHRPLECVALNCRDTSKIKEMYNRGRLTRRHLLSKIKGMWELVEDHQDHCDYAYVAELADKINRKQPIASAEKRLLELIRYDRHLREVTMERTKMDSEMLSFLLGRPLSFTIKLFHLKIDRTPEGARILPDDSQGPVCYRRDGF